MRTTHPLEPIVGSPLGAKQFWQVSEALWTEPESKPTWPGAGLD